VDYALLADEAIDITIQGKYLLIETLIEELAQHCLNQPLVQAVRVKIEKPEAIETADSVGISIYRSN
jgi:FolB domain-containing protein